MKGAVGGELLARSHLMACTLGTRLAAVLCEVLEKGETLVDVAPLVHGIREAHLDNAENDVHVLGRMRAVSELLQKGSVSAPAAVSSRLSRFALC